MVDGLEEDWVLGAGAKSFQELLVGRVAERSDDANGNEEELGFGRRIGDQVSGLGEDGSLLEVHAEREGGYS